VRLINALVHTGMASSPSCQVQTLPLIPASTPRSKSRPSRQK
jgi:hypothetical protein